MVVLSDIEHIHECLLSKKAKDFNGRVCGSVQYAYCGVSQETPKESIQGIGTSVGKIWKDNRKLAYHYLLSKKSLQQLKSIFIDEIEFFTNEVDNMVNQPIESLSTFMKISSNMISQAAFGCRLYPINLVDIKSEEITNQDDFYYANIGMVDTYLPFLSKYPFKSLKQYGSNVALIRGVLKDIIVDYKLNNHDYIPFMNSMIETEGQDLESNITLMLDILLAGSDSTGKTLSFFFLLLAHHKEEAEKCYEEISNLHSTHQSLHDIPLKQLTFIEACLYESMRMYPAAPLALPHMCTANQKLDGQDISEGTVIVTNIYSVHRNIKNWAHADKFKPQRFIDNPELLKSPNLLPFGIGARSCIGKDFAIMEMKLLAAALLLKYQVETSNYSHIDEGMYNTNSIQSYNSL